MASGNKRIPNTAEQLAGNQHPHHTPPAVMT